MSQQIYIVYKLNLFHFQSIPGQFDISHVEGVYDYYPYHFVHQSSSFKITGPYNLQTNSISEKSHVGSYNNTTNLINFTDITNKPSEIVNSYDFTNKNASLSMNFYNTSKAEDKISKKNEPWIYDTWK